MARERILIIEDDPDYTEFLLANVMSPQRYLAQTATCGQAGLKAAQEERFDLILLDLDLDDVTSAEMLRRLQTSGDPAVILITPPGKEGEALHGFRLGARDALIKPFTAEEVTRAIARVMHQERLAGERDWLVRKLAAANGALERSLAELQTLHDVSTSVGSSLNLEDVLSAVVQAAVSITHAEEGYLLLRDEDSDKFHLRAALSGDAGHVTGLRVQVAHADSIAGHVVRTGEPVVLSGSGDARLKIETGDLVRSLINVPLRGQDQVIGVLGVYNVASEQDLTERDARLLSALANYAAIAVNNAQVYTQTDQTLNRRVEEALVVQAELSVALHKTDLILRNIAEGIYTVNQNLQITSANPAMERITGWRASELVGRRYDEVFAPESEGRRLLPEQTLPGKALESATASAQSTILRKDNRRIPVTGTAVLLKGADASVIGVLATMRDLTSEIELRQVRREFTTMLIHWLRTPLTQISASMEALLQANLPHEMRREVCDVLHTQSSHLAQLAEEMLDVVRLEAGTTQPRLHPVMLKPIVDQVVKNFQQAAPGRSFQVVLAPDLPVVIGDESKIELALANLIDNALAAGNPQQPVVISAEVSGDCVVVTVKRRGITVSPGEPVRFAQFPSSVNGQSVSSANYKPWRVTPEMGLYVARELIRTQGGRVWIEDQPGTNAQFQFSLPKMEVRGDAQTLTD